MRLLPAVPALLLVGLLLHPDRADAATFVIPMDGLQVVDANGQTGTGHPSATGIATLVLDAATDTASWSFSVPLNLLPITTSGIYRDFGGTTDELVIEFSGLVGTGLVDADIDAVLLYPTLYYVELGNNAYPAGAIRGQLPEPGTLGLLGAALAGLVLLRRRT